MDRRTFLATVGAGSSFALAGCVGDDIVRALGRSQPDPRLIDHAYEEREYQLRDWVGDSQERRGVVIAEVINEGDAGGVQVYVETYDSNDHRLNRFNQPVYLEADEYVQVAVGGITLTDMERYEVRVVADDDIGPSYASDGNHCTLDEDGSPVGDDGRCPMGHYG